MSSKMVQVEVSANAGTEFIITDSRRLKVHSGVGAGKFSLEPGIYKARFMAGGLSRDQLFEVEEELVRLDAPELRIASPVPLQGTSTTHEYHEGPAVMLAHQPPMILGKGSELAFLVRDSQKQLGEGIPVQPWQGLSLRSLAGNAYADFSDASQHDENTGVATLRVAVDPGIYLLTLRQKFGGVLQLPVASTAGWLTTVYLDCRGREDERELDLYGTSVVISGQHDDFYSGNPTLRMAELAKQAIQRGRATVDAAALSKMMQQKFEYPMLGVFVAHVLLLADTPDVATLKIVLGNLDRMLPGNPDVLALHCALARHVPGFQPAAGPALERRQLSGPPMLRNSWEMLLDAAPRYRNLLPVNADWMRYTSALCGSRVWLVWQQSRVESFFLPKENRLSAGPTSSQRSLLSGSKLPSWSQGLEGRFDQYLSANKMALNQSLAELKDLAKIVLATQDDRLNRKHLIAIWTSVREALKDPSIAQNPLQSSLRRKLLALIEEDDADPEADLSLEATARDFRVPTRVLIAAATSLFQIATAHCAARSLWDDIDHRFPVGSKIHGKVVNLVPYGAIIELEEGIDGMVHVSDISWTRKINHPSEMLKKGDEVDAIILDVDPSQQRISLGIKQIAASDPWTDIDTFFRIGDVVPGVISKITTFGAFVELKDGIDGLVHISQIQEDRVDKVKDVLKPGQKVTARVIKIDREQRRIGLSIKAANYSAKKLMQEASDYDSFIKRADSSNLSAGDTLV